MRNLFALLIGLGVGLGLIALGVSIFTYGLGQPINCQGYTNRSACGNLLLIVGVFITLAGLVTTSGTVIYAIKVQEHSVEDPSDE